MEDVLHLYEQPYDPLRPVVCFDERPCQLLKDVFAPLPASPGRPERYDHNYQRQGVVQMLVAFEPHQGRRIVEVWPRRRKREYAEFMEQLAREHYPDADKIIVIQDNLNTHTPSSFYERFSASKALELTQRFEFHYTPKNASWLNMVEIELSALVREALPERVSSIEELRERVVASVMNRNRRRASVHWQFTPKKARSKFNRFYKKLN